MTKKSLLLASLGIIAGGAIIANQVSAYQGNPSVKGPNYTAERHELMEKAFDNNDYYAWKKLMDGRGGRVLQVVNEKNFSLFAKAHRLAEEGKITEANSIRSELGLGMHNGSGSNEGRGFGRSR